MPASFPQQILIIFSKRISPKSKCNLPTGEVRHFQRGGANIIPINNHPVYSQNSRVFPVSVLSTIIRWSEMKVARARMCAASNVWRKIFSSLLPGLMFTLRLRVKLYSPPGKACSTSQKRSGRSRRRVWRRTGTSEVSEDHRRSEAPPLPLTWPP